MYTKLILQLEAEYKEAQKRQVSCTAPSGFMRGIQKAKQLVMDEQAKHGVIVELTSAEVKILHTFTNRAFRESYTLDMFKQRIESKTEIDFLIATPKLSENTKLLTSICRKLEDKSGY